MSGIALRFPPTGVGVPEACKEPADAMVAFTSLEAEMGKPVDASDLCTPRGTPQIDLARTEVQRLRRLLEFRVSEWNAPLLTKTTVVLKQRQTCCCTPGGAPA